MAKKRQALQDAQQARLDVARELQENADTEQDGADDCVQRKAAATRQA